MKIVTPEGLITNLHWWDQMRAEGSEIIFQKKSKKLIMRCENEELAKSLFGALNHSILAGITSFDAHAFLEEAQKAV